LENARADHRQLRRRRDTSSGIEHALGRPPDIAINHDPAALAMHAANHPRTLHVPHNVWKVSLKELVGHQPIGLLWMSPDCRHHSKAKGGAPVSPSVRDLAWVALRWLRELPPWQRPRRIFLENAEEFRKWCPLIDDGQGGLKPDPARERRRSRRGLSRPTQPGHSRPCRARAALDGRRQGFDARRGRRAHALAEGNGAPRRRFSPFLSSCSDFSGGPPRWR